MTPFRSLVPWHIWDSPQSAKIGKTSRFLYKWKLLFENKDNSEKWTLPISLKRTTFPFKLNSERSAAKFGKDDNRKIYLSPSKKRLLNTDHFSSPFILLHLCLVPQNAKMLFEQTTRWKTSKTENANFGTFSRFYFFTSIQENVCLSGLRTKLPDIKLQYVKYPPENQNVPFISTYYLEYCFLLCTMACPIKWNNCTTLATYKV